MSKYIRFTKKVLSADLLVKKLQQAARIYQKYVDKDLLIVYGKNRNGPFFSYEWHAGKENFQHLAGIKSPKGAKWFFEKCLDKEHPLTYKDIIPNDNIKSTSTKISILSDALDLKKAKAYRIGDKDKITLHNSFEIAIGNTTNVMGIDKRKKKLPMPVTVMDRSIYDFCTNVYTIYLIMTKRDYEQTYTDVFYEITDHILEKAMFDESVWQFIEGRKINQIESTLEIAATLDTYSDGY